MPGIVAGTGNRVAVGTLTIEVGGMAETVEVKGESPVIQATTGERSFTVTTESVENLPIANRSFTALASLAPGVSGNNRIGGGGANNIMMDGVSTMDTGSNSPLLQMNVESIAEVKVLVSNYQAEYGRSSGLQVTAVTKSGTNRFRGSVYDVERNSDWNSNSTRSNKLNGDPKTVLKQRDFGYSIGGPIGKPGGSNKLFFFYSHEFAPRTGGNDVQRFRMPTALERQGDFSQTTDNNGNPFQRSFAIRGSTGNCSTTNANDRPAALPDGGVLGQDSREPALPDGPQRPEHVPDADDARTCRPGRPTTTRSLARPSTLLAWQPAIRLDYNVMPSLRTTFKYSGLAAAESDHQRIAAGFQRHPDARAGRQHVDGDGQLQPDADDVPRSDVWAEQQRARGLRRGAGRHRPDRLPERVPDESDGRIASSAGLGGLPYLFPDAVKIQERVLRLRRARRACRRRRSGRTAAS